MPSNPNIKQMQLHISLQLFTITPISFYYNYTCRRVKWGEHGTNATLATFPRQQQSHLNPERSFSPKNWVQIYSNQKEIKYISPSNISHIRASVESRPPQLHIPPILSRPPIPVILWAWASRSSAIHVFLVIDVVYRSGWSIKSWCCCSSVS